MKKSLKVHHNQSYSSESQSEPDIYLPRKNRKNMPRFTKNQIEDVNTQAIIVNVAKTQYPIIQEVVIELGWEVQNLKKSQAWDIMWIDSHIQVHDLFKLNQHQKISHYPSIQVLTRKNMLGRSLMKMNKLFPEQYNFFPFTWNIPSQYTELIRYDSKLKVQNTNIHYYIYKPEAQAQGRGIKLYETLEPLQSKSGIVQTYINNPYLIEKLKFDLRIYVLIFGLNPLRIFIYNEGLGRFATQKYQKVCNKNIKDSCMHLTNYAINKKNRSFIYNKSQKQMDKGHKRSLSAIYSYLQKKGVNIQSIKNQIDQIIVKTLIVGEPTLRYSYNLSRSNQKYNDLCFQLLGFDIMITQNHQAKLIQVNHTPSFKTDTPLDKFIKKNLIKDTLKLLNVNIERKRQMINEKKQFFEMRSQRKLSKINEQNKNIVNQDFIQQRNLYQEQNLGNFRKIYPMKDGQKYKLMVQQSQRIFNQQNGLKNRINSKKQNEKNRPKSLNNNRIQSSPIKHASAILKTSKIFNNSTSKQLYPKDHFKVEQIISKFPTIGFLKNRQQVPEIDLDVNKLALQKCIENQQANVEREKSKQLNMQFIDKGKFLEPKVMGLESLKAEKSFKQLNRYRQPSASPNLARRSYSKSTRTQQKIGVLLKSSTNMGYKKQDQKVINYKNLLSNLIGNVSDRWNTIQQQQNSTSSKMRFQPEYLVRNTKR